MISLIGYFGEENLGDDIMLSNVINRLVKQYELKVICNKFSVTLNQEFPNVEQVILNKNNFKKLVKTFINSKAIVWVGGTCLYDKENKKGLKELFVIFLFNTFIIRKFHFFNIGLGEINTRLGNFLIKFMLKFSKSVVFRDELSLLSAKKIFNRDYVLGGDLFLLRKVTKQAVLNKKGILIFGVYNLNQKYAKKIASFLDDNINSSHISKVQFIPFHRGKKNDDIFHKKIIDSMYNKDACTFVNYNNIDDLVKNIKSSQYAICIRLHSSVLCDLLNIPSLSVEYSPKIHNYCISVKKNSVSLDYLITNKMQLKDFKVGDDRIITNQVLRVESSFSKLLEFV